MACKRNAGQAGGGPTAVSPVLPAAQGEEAWLAMAWNEACHPGESAGMRSAPHLLPRMPGLVEQGVNLGHRHGLAP